MTVSGGVASASRLDDLKSLMARADAALLSAKAAGRNRIHRNAEINSDYLVGETREMPGAATIAAQTVAPS